MANQEHLDILKQGAMVWNAWREEHINQIIWENWKDGITWEHIRHIRDLSEGADIWYIMLISEALKSNMEICDNEHILHPDLRRVDLNGANLWGANLRRADLIGANLKQANLSGANLSGANLRWADLRKVSLYKADLRWADLEGVDLSEACLSKAKLRKARLRKAQLIQTDFTNADLTGCHIYGVSAWNVQLEGAIQKDLVITDYDEPEITVDNLKVAQFIYLLL